MTSANVHACQSSARAKEVVVVSCVTFETAKVVDPIFFYQATRVHLINYVKDENDPDLKVYGDFCQEVINQLRERMGMRDDQIVLHRRPVYDFSSMMEVLHCVLKEEKGPAIEDKEVYVNVSAGTAEYTAAATIASMMVPGVKPFTVSTRKYFVPPEKLREIYYEDNRPVGMSKEVRDPSLLGIYPIEEPPEDLVRGLRILHEMMKAKKRTSQKNVIQELETKGVWRYEHKPRRPGSDKAKKDQSVTMHYRRHFLEKWKERGWLCQGDRRLEITESGLCIINTFYKDR